MTVIDLYLQGLVAVLSWPSLLFLVLAVFIGVLIGAIPGIGPAVGVTVLLPLTIPMEASQAIVFLMGIYAGSMYGGSIPAILMNTPGVVAAAATTFDGYPMTKANKARTAITVSAFSSSLGILVSSLALLAIFPFIINLLLLFKTPHYFLIALLGLSLIAIISRGSMPKGLMVGVFGLLISTAGYAPVTGEIRYTFGLLNLSDGLSFVAVLLGVFAIAEMIKLANKPGAIADIQEVSGSVADGLTTTVANIGLVVKSAFIGMLIGMVPGAGASISSFVSYAAAVRGSDDPSSFGRGNPRGIIASEAANNGTVGGAIIPTLAFGIPGSGVTAIVLGALLLQGLRPGTNLFSDDSLITITILTSLAVSAVIIIVIGITMMTQFSYIVKVDTDYIIPVVVVLSVVGTFSIRNNWIDVITIIAFGVIGYYMDKHDYSLITLVLGIILGPIAEENFRRSLLLSNGSWDIFVSDSLGIALAVALVVVLVAPLVTELGLRERLGV